MVGNVTFDSDLKGQFCHSSSNGRAADWKFVCYWFESSLWHQLMYLWCNGSIADSKSVRSGFESLGVRQFNLREVLSGCIRGLGPCGLGSNPSMETKFLCSGGREAQCSGLQIRKTVSSNLTRYSSLLLLRRFSVIVRYCRLSMWCKPPLLIGTIWSTSYPFVQLA